MKNFMLIERVSAYMYVGFAENTLDIPRRGVEKFDVLIPDGRDENNDPILQMKARCIYHLPHNCFLMHIVDDGGECDEHTALMKSHCAYNKQQFLISDHGREQTAISQILQELRLAEEVHPHWPEEAVHAGAIVSEESGELLRDCVSFDETGEAYLLVNMGNEARQTGAMALRFMKNLGTSNLRTIQHDALRSILDSEKSPEEQLIEVRRLMNNGAQ